MLGSATDREWQKWGEADPYFGVLGEQSDTVRSDTAKHRVFMATGVRDLERTLTDVEQLFGEVHRGSALDFGCGVGRIMSAMFGAGFQQVDGVDVSPAMVEEARRNLNGTSRFYSSLDDAPGGYDFAHSYIVLQHIRPAQGIPIIRKLVEQVKPGGAFAIHFLASSRRGYVPMLNFLRYRFKPLHMAYNAVRGRPLSDPVMEMNPYPVWKVVEAVEDLTGLLGLRPVPTQKGAASVMLMGRRAE